MIESWLYQNAGMLCRLFTFSYIRLCYWRRYTWFIEMRKHKLPQGYVCVYALSSMHICVCIGTVTFFLVLGVIFERVNFKPNRTEPNQSKKPVAERMWLDVLAFGHAYVKTFYVRIVEYDK